MINKIGIENFRVFKEYIEFEIKPITLLVGPNNAGKSSFTKLLLLLKNGVQKLNFENGLHNLESFNKILNWDKKNDVVKLSFNSEIPIFDKNFTTQFSYEKGQISKISIVNNETTFLDFNFKEKNNYNSTQTIDFNINYLIDLIYNKEIIGSILLKDKNGNLVEEENSLKYLNFQKLDVVEVTFSNLKETYEKMESIDTDLNVLSSISLYNEIDKLDNDYLLYDIIVNDQKITKIYSNKIRELQNTIFSKLQFDKQNMPEEYGGNIDDKRQLLKSLLNEINNNVKKQILNYFKEELEVDTVEIKETPLGNIIFLEKLYDDYDAFGNKVFFQKTLLQQIIKFTSSLDNWLKRIEYLSANRGNHKRVLENKSTNDIDEIVLDFFNKKDFLNENFTNPNATERMSDKIEGFQNKKRQYFEEILSILEIDGTIEIERFENVISVVYIKMKEKKIALSDLGFGFSQIIPIILKISNISKSKYSQTLIIEEPEANLHPNLQSKLADIFIITLKYYPEFNFIIETHSEYFIRRLQYLTAKNDISIDKTIIYYFNADKYVSVNEPKVKKIEIKSDGNLSDNFGPGFYDETTRLQFDLMRLNQEQYN